MTEFEKEVTKRRKQIDKAKQKVSNLYDDLAIFLKNCPHDKVSEKSSYFPGSYNDKAYTNYWNQCDICGTKSEITTKDHSWYG